MDKLEQPDLSDLNDRTARILQDAYRAGFKAGYQSGYGAAMTALVDAAKANAQFPFEQDIMSDLGNQDAYSAGHVDHTNNVRAVAQTSSGRAAPGSIKNLVRTFVLTAGRPVTEAEFAARFPNVLRPSRYMAFRTLGQEGVIVKENGKWVPASKSAAKPDLLASGPDNISHHGAGRNE